MSTEPSISAEPPIWGSPESGQAPAREGGGVQDAPRGPSDAPPPPPNVYWNRTPAGPGPFTIDPGAIQRQANVALVVNLLVLFLLLGLCSAVGAAMALRARTLAWTDPARAQRSLTWSWVLLASNLLLWVLLVVVIVLVALSFLKTLIPF
jgi:hypothetical protein